MPPILIKPVGKTAYQPIFLYSPFSIPISQRTSLTQNNYFIFAQKQLLNKLNKKSIFNDSNNFIFYSSYALNGSYKSIIGVINIGYKIQVYYIEIIFYSGDLAIFFILNFLIL